MKQFYELYKDDEKVSPLVTQLSWTNHLKIMSASKSQEERRFYIELAVKERYSKRELERQMDSGYYERFMLSNGNMLPAIQKAKQETHNLFLDKYVLELAHGMGALDLLKFEPFPQNPVISKVLIEIGLADELGSGMRNTYKYTQLYSGQNPLFEEGDIFRTIIPLKKIATQKGGGGNVSRNVPQDVSRMSFEEIENIIKGMIKEDNRVSRKGIAMILGVSEKTITRYIKNIPNIKYVGKGGNGH